MGKNEVVVCETNFKDAKAKCVKGNLCLEKQSACLFDQGIEKTQKVCEEVSNKKTFRRPVEHPQSFSRALGKTLTEFASLHLSCEYIYILYSLYICCSILTVAIASLKF